MSIPQQILHSSGAKSRAIADVPSAGGHKGESRKDSEAKTGSLDIPKPHAQEIDKIIDEDSLKELGSSNSKDKKS